MHQKIVLYIFPFIFPNHKKIKRISLGIGCVVCFATSTAALCCEAEFFFCGKWGKTVFLSYALGSVRGWWEWTFKNEGDVNLQEKTRESRWSVELQEKLSLDWGVLNPPVFFSQHSYLCKTQICFCCHIFTFTHVYWEYLRPDTRNCYKWHFFYEYFIHYNAKGTQRNI